MPHNLPTILHRTVVVDGLSIFYRETSDPTNPKYYRRISVQYDSLILNAV